MMTAAKIQEQLKQKNCHYIGWGSTEVAQLCGILVDDEEIIMAINGYYEGGFGLLCVTNLRVLIIDKKPLVLNIEDLRYDMITEVTYGARFIIATIRMALPTRTVYFSSWSMDKLNVSMKYIQEHVMEARVAVSSPSDQWLTSVIPKTPSHVAPIRSALRLNRLVGVIRSAFRSSETIDFKEESSPFIVHTSSQRGINPYAKLPSLQRRRRYPIFYQLT